MPLCSCVPVTPSTSLFGPPPPPLPLQVVARLEAVLSQKRFTQLGGLQLEKDVRLLVGEWRASGAGCDAGFKACWCWCVQHGNSHVGWLLNGLHHLQTLTILCPHFRTLLPAQRACRT